MRMSDMLEDWFQRSELSEEARNITYEVINPLITRFMNTPQAWNWSGIGLPNVSNRNSQYRTISSELEETSNFFMKRFTVRT